MSPFKPLSFDEYAAGQLKAGKDEGELHKTPGIKVRTGKREQPGD